MKAGQNLEFLRIGHFRKIVLQKKALLSTEAIIFDTEDLIYRHREFSGDYFELYTEVLSRIFWNSIDLPFCDLKFEIFFFVFFDFLTKDETESGKT
jgi:hypothetical protein